MLHKLLCLIGAALRITILVVQDADGEDVLEDVQATSKCSISDLDCHNVYNISNLYFISCKNKWLQIYQKWCHSGCLQAEDSQMQGNHL